MAKRQIRPVRVVGQVAYVELTQGFVATIDAQDAPMVAKHNWAIIPGKRTTYVARQSKAGGKAFTVYLHRAILDAPDGFDVDHINRDGLDNRRSNLRIATRSENSMNRGANTENKLGIKGVYANPSGLSWCARIRVQGKSHYLGSFPSPEEAQMAYAKASAELHGEFGCIA